MVKMYLNEFDDLISLNSDSIILLTFLRWQYRNLEFYLSNDTHRKLGWTRRRFVKARNVLIAALATLTDLPWRLTIAGDRTRDPQVATQLDADIAHHALGDRIVVAGEVSAQHLEKLYVDADVFTLASRFEGYGMAYAEAIAHGLPVVGTSAGAIPDTVPRGAGILVAPDNPAAFAQAIRHVIEDPNERLRLRTAARAAAGSLPTWQVSAQIFSRAVEAVE